MSVIRRMREAAGLTQAALAEAGGTSQPTIAAYEAEKKSPTLNTVNRLARAAALEATVVFHPPMTREERRSLALHEMIADRLRDDPDTVLGRARETLARMQSIAAASSQPLREWSVLLDRPVPAIVEILTDTAPWARELRHVTPFAGVLSAAERAKALRAFAASETEVRNR